MDPSVISNVDPSTVVSLIAGLTIACLGAPLALASAACIAPAALVCGYVGCAAGAYCTALTAPLVPCLLPLGLIPLVHAGLGCGGNQTVFQWRY